MLKDIIAIAEKPGLYRLLSSANNGNTLIVESLQDKKRFPVFGSSQPSALADIAIYTDTEEVPLKELFKTIFNKLEGKKCEVKRGNAKDLQTFMAEILPNYDRERVYVSDMKKIFSWYNLLLNNNLLKFEEENIEQTTESAE